MTTVRKSEVISNNFNVNRNHAHDWVIKSYNYFLMAIASLTIWNEVFEGSMDRQDLYVFVILFRFQ
jgi:hypothetical protein